MVSFNKFFRNFSIGIEKTAFAWYNYSVIFSQEVNILEKQN